MRFGLPGAAAGSLDGLLLGRAMRAALTGRTSAFVWLSAAAPPTCLRLVMSDGMRVVLAGVFVGVLAAPGLTQLMSSLLFGVSAADALTFS